MPVERRHWFTRAALQAEPDALFVFGDNIARTGLGGQARACRGEPNAVGLVTKRSPYVFLTDDDAEEVVQENSAALRRLADHLEAGGKIVIPAAGIGTGKAELRQRAPTIATYYDLLLGALG